ncbi:hypothetical protein C1H87_13625 [Flavivirga eckloniae]|uniref:Uncharacterized protein n=1 Tax=Flavivirga eckloniae TaxID=1803846 RepID=A0A2K9PRJ6_9FLAO|nr:hypothetical protein C1H87_13625 [Flavivirga eckloniae]
MHKKGHGTQLITLEVLEYRALISEPTPGYVSQSTYRPSAKISSFLTRDSKQLLQYFKRRIAKICISWANIGKITIIRVSEQLFFHYSLHLDELYIYRWIITSIKKIKMN